MSTDEAAAIEAAIEAGFYKTFLRNGTREHVYLDLRYDQNAPSPIVFHKSNPMFVKYMKANIGGKNIYINRNEFSAALKDVHGLRHEFGHILGFKHANNGRLDLMSYDSDNYFTERHLDMINKKY